MKNKSKGNTHVFSIYEFDKNYIKYNLNKEKNFKIPTNNGIRIVKNHDLAEYIIEVQTNDENRKLVEMIKKIKKRNMPVRPLFKTIGIGLFSKYNFLFFLFVSVPMLEN